MEENSNTTTHVSLSGSIQVSPVDVYTSFSSALRHTERSALDLFVWLVSAVWFGARVLLKNINLSAAVASFA